MKKYNWLLLLTLGCTACATKPVVQGDYLCYGPKTPIGQLAKFQGATYHILSDGGICFKAHPYR